VIIAKLGYDCRWHNTKTQSFAPDAFAPIEPLSRPEIRVEATSILLDQEQLDQYSFVYEGSFMVKMLVFNFFDWFVVKVLIHGIKVLSYVKKIYIFVGSGLNDTRKLFGPPPKDPDLDTMPGKHANDFFQEFFGISCHDFSLAFNSVVILACLR
jgi:hypothetical protein